MDIKEETIYIRTSKINNETKEEIKKLFDSGKSITSISDMINISGYYVRRTLKEDYNISKVYGKDRVSHKIKEEIKKLYDEGMTITYISNKTKLTSNVLQRILGIFKDYSKHPPKQKQIKRKKTSNGKILHDYFNKLSITELQLKYNVSKYIIYNILKENNIEIPINERSKRYNRFAMKVFKEFDTRNNTKGLYGRDEFYIEKYRYYLDYINLDLKLIIEWDEEQHKYQTEEDKIREENIKQELPDFTFKRIDELNVINTINDLFLSEEEPNQ